MKLMIFIGCVCSPLLTLGQTSEQNPISVPDVNGTYEIKVANVVMEVDANCGARIISFRLKNQEVLSSSKVHPENFGSTLWLSPQIWKWPPFPLLDTRPYHSEFKKHTLSKKRTHFIGKKLSLSKKPSSSKNSQTKFFIELSPDQGFSKFHNLSFSKKI